MRSNDRRVRAPIRLLSAIAAVAVGLVAAGPAMAAPEPVPIPLTAWSGQGTVGGNGQVLNTTICDSQNTGYLQWNLTASADTARISFDGGATWNNMGTPTGGVFKYISLPAPAEPG